MFLSPSKKTATIETIFLIRGEPDDDQMDGIDALVGDRIRGEPRNATEDEKVRHFDKLEEDAKRELYPGYTDYSILKFVIEMLNVKVMTSLSNKGLDMMLELLTKVLPKGNSVPRSTYEAKKILNFDASINCIFFSCGIKSHNVRIFSL